MSRAAGGRARRAGVSVRPVGRSDRAAWLRMRCALWPDGSESEHRDEIGRFLAGRAREPLAVLIAEDPARGPVGFAEMSIRPNAEGCVTSRVAYLEGWFVAPEARRLGVGRRLAEAVEEWSRRRRCTELASDSAASDRTSRAAHRAVGFEEVGLVRCYRKEL